MAIIKVKTGGITADAITDALIADDVVGTEHLTANEVDTTALGADAVTGAQLADDAVNSEHYTDGSIDTAHLADGQVTTAKLATAVFTGATDIGAAIADADLFLMDDGAGGTIRKTAASRIKTYAASSSSVYFQVNKTSNQTISNASSTKLTWDNAVTQSSSAFDLTNNKFTATVAGRYLFAVRVGFYDSDNNLKRATIYNYKNNNNYRTTDFFMADGGIRNATVYDTWIEDVSVNDYFEVYVLQNTTDSGDMLVTGGSNWETSFSGFILT
jgi:hypothetical protein